MGSIDQSECQDGQRPVAYAEVTRSSSKEQGIGFKYGYSDPTGNVDTVLAELRRLKQGVEDMLKEAT